ncbi:MAG: ribbon-helix-helix domain-containing protein [Pyrobaculum sp.]
MMAVQRRNIMISLYLPEDLIEKLDELVRAGFFGSRTEAIRYAAERLVEQMSPRVPQILPQLEPNIQRMPPVLQEQQLTRDIETQQNQEEAQTDEKREQRQDNATISNIRVLL